ncbi:DUF5959 family protein [Streptomyces sp. NPDC091201]|uniref:DUF5959 family protein n=1 Tax=Streptomyces sp. NPDC091201 TaxID=3155190 RepID=UPI00341C632B
MGENAAGDLICLVDTDSSVRVRVPGRNRPGTTPYNDHLDAELVISSVFVSGRLGCACRRKPWTTGQRPLMSSPTGGQYAGGPWATPIRPPHDAGSSG